MSKTIEISDLNPELFYRYDHVNNQTMVEYIVEAIMSSFRKRNLINEKVQKAVEKECELFARNFKKKYPASIKGDKLIDILNSFESNIFKKYITIDESEELLQKEVCSFVNQLSAKNDSIFYPLSYQTIKSESTKYIADLVKKYRVESYSKLQSKFDDELFKHTHLGINHTNLPKETEEQSIILDKVTVTNIINDKQNNTELSLTV